MLKVMLTGAFIGIKHAFPIMKEQGYGRIINMASINGVIGFAGKAAYNSAKHGLIGLTKVAALEGAAHGITVNASARAMWIPPGARTNGGPRQNPQCTAGKRAGGGHLSARPAETPAGR